MSLHALPVELRLKIAEQLHPRTCFKLALASRNDHSVYSSLLAKYKAIFARYNTINTAGAGRLLWDITKEIIETPNLAPYIEDVSLPDTRQLFWNTDAHINIMMPTNPAIVPEELVRLYMDSAESHPIMPEIMQQFDYKHHWFGSNWDMGRSIRIGSDEPIIALLVALAPNLRILRLTQTSLQPELILLLKYVASAYADPVKAPSLPLQHLTYAAVAHDDTEMGCSAEWAYFFMMIPTLKGFAARQMASDGDGDLLGERVSNVTDLLFLNSLLDRGDMLRVVRGTKGLRSYCYENGGPSVSESGNYAVRSIGNALAEHAADSLEELIFISGHEGLNEDEDDEGEPAPPIPWRRFQKLRMLRCSLWDLVAEQVKQNLEKNLNSEDGVDKDEEDEEHRQQPTGLAQSLPTSIEHLYLEVDHEDSCYLQDVVTAMREIKEMLPNLKTMAVQDFTKTLDSSDLQVMLKERQIAWQDDEYGFAFSNASKGYTLLAPFLEGQGEQ